MQLVERLAEDGGGYFFPVLVEEKYLDVPFAQWETLHPGRLIATAFMSSTRQAGISAKLARIAMRVGGLHGLLLGDELHGAFDLPRTCQRGQLRGNRPTYVRHVGDVVMRACVSSGRLKDSVR